MNNVHVHYVGHCLIIVVIYTNSDSSNSIVATSQNNISTVEIASYALHFNGINVVLLVRRSDHKLSTNTQLPLPYG